MDLGANLSNNLPTAMTLEIPFAFLRQIFISGPVLQLLVHLLIGNLFPTNPSNILWLLLARLYFRVRGCCHTDSSCTFKLPAVSDFLNAFLDYIHSAIGWRLYQSMLLQQNIDYLARLMVPGIFRIRPTFGRYLDWVWLSHLKCVGWTEEEED